MKLFDSELKVMDVLWTNGDMPARQIAAILTESIGWNVNTTYTLIKRCIAKNAIERIEPGFLCHALVSKQQVQEEETQELIDKVFDGSADKLFAALVGGKRVSAEQLQGNRSLVQMNLHQFFGIFVMIKNRLCADHFRTDHSCSLLMAEQTKWQVADTCHWR